MGFPVQANKVGIVLFDYYFVRKYPTLNDNRYVNVSKIMKCITHDVLFHVLRHNHTYTVLHTHFTYLPIALLLLKRKSVILRYDIPTMGVSRIFR